MTKVNLGEIEWIECRACETPCYTFEVDQRRGVLATALCLVCGNDDPNEFRIPEPGEEE